MLEVLSPGLQTTVQDAGRPRAAPLGVPPSGACDPWSLAVANLLVGNAPDAACVEVTIVGPELRVLESCTVAIAGAELGAVVAEERRPLRAGHAHRLRGGTTVRFEAEAAGSGARSYVAVPGGIDTEPVLGSRSTYLRGGFGGIDGRSLQPGDRLVPIRRDDGGLAGRAWPATIIDPAFGPVAPLRIVLGPHGARFADALADELQRGEWRVAADSDRMGLRLDGPRLSRAAAPELVSHPLVWGALQVPPDARPIVLLADHQTVGGYPVAGVVARADRPRLGQLLPGDVVRFRVVSIATAQDAYREQLARLAQGAAVLRSESAWDELPRLAR